MYCMGLESLAGACNKGKLTCAQRLARGASWQNHQATGTDDRGRDKGLSLAPPSEPDGRFSRIRLSSQWVPVSRDWTP